MINKYCYASIQSKSQSQWRDLGHSGLCHQQLNGNESCTSSIWRHSCHINTNKVAIVTITEVIKPITPQQQRVTQLKQQLDQAKLAQKRAKLAQQQIKLNQQRAALIK
jgi:hypothetical protein